MFKVFTDLDFYGSPVELELVADNLLLGFYVDVSERTVIYKLPDIRQIRDNVSAGTLRLRLSGLKSRAHLIRKYSFPSCQAQSSLHALSRLYVQKGFALSDIHSSLWPTNTSGDRPLCVGPTPVSKGFANFSVFQYFSFSVLRQGVDPRVQRTHFFTGLGVVWRQIRGAGIGSQISPTLSNLAVTLIERTWSSTYQEVLTQPNFHHLAIKYVDSRFVIVQKHHLQAPVFKVFTDLDFYGSPVELELVADNLLLGFYVDVSERTVIYKLPDIRQIRDNVSAGTLRLRLSGLKSRAHLIRKYSFPSCQASSLHALSRLYVQKGFALSDIHSALWPLCVGPTPVSKGFANFSVLQHFSFSVLRQGVQAAHSVLHQRRHWMSAGDI